ncbi:hypothetical protein M0Q50_06665 [bacterium]|jgi:hypothetical protein|nr:hypothetical protein [bacterium]
MNCRFCNKEISNKGGLIKHENGCKLNPQRIYYECNFKFKTKNSNQWKLAKEEGRKIILSDETISKLKLANLGNHHSKETKEKLSMIRSKYLEEIGKGGFKNIKWYRISNINDQEFVVRGTWELNIAKILNENSILWVRKVYLKYEDEEGILRTYTPDFYIPETETYLEIKGYFSKKDKEKIKKVKLKNNIKLIVIEDKLYQSLLKTRVITHLL